MQLALQNNRLIRKIILSMFGGSLAAMITSAVAMMADTILAGAVFGKLAIAAVAVGTPIINIFQALVQTVIHGASIKMNVSAGKGETEEIRRSFASAAFFTATMALLLVLLSQFFASTLVRLFGGSEEVAELAVWYLRGASGCIFFGSINLFMTKTMALYGMQKTIFRSAFLAVSLNVVFSLLLMKVLPERIAIMGLGMGTWMGGCVAAVTAYFSLRKHRLSFRVKRSDLRLSTLKGFVVHGLPSSGNALADGVVSGVVNNLITSGFSNGVLALAVYTAVKSVVTFASAIIQAVNLAAAPLFGIMYGARDKNGLLRSYGESIRLAMFTLLFCAVAVAACSPILAKIFDMQGSADFLIGLGICMFVYQPLTALIKLTTQFFESIENPLMGFLYSAIPDSLIYPLMLAVLLPTMGYTGMWIAYSCNVIPFVLVLYLIRSIAGRSLKVNADRLFCLDKEIRDNVPKIDISISSDNRDVTFISEQVFTFLEKEGINRRTSHTTALCLEELAADFVAHTDAADTRKTKSIIMDIKLFADEDRLRVIIRNESAMYNPLDFELDSESFSKMGVKLAQKLANSITYHYVYKMNIITIDINR